MNEEELKSLALQLHKAQIQEYPWVSADPEDAESYIRTYGDTNVHLYYDYLLDCWSGDDEYQYLYDYYEKKYPEYNQELKHYGK